MNTTENENRANSAHTRRPKRVFTETKDPLKRRKKMKPRKFFNGYNDFKILLYVMDIEYDIELCINIQLWQHNASICVVVLDVVVVLKLGYMSHSAHYV